MKLIEAVISVTSLEEIRTALSSIGIDRVRVSAFAKNSHNKGKGILDLGADYVSGFMTRIKVEIIAADELVGKVIDTIGETVIKERHGFCRILIHSLAESPV
jgi:nitrogen regulatory protein P-II 2